MLVFNTLKLFPPQVPHTPQHPRQVESLEAAAVILEQEFEKCELIKVETCGAANPKIDDRQGSEYLDLCFFIFQHDEETIIPRNGLDFLICGSISLRLMFSNTIDSDTLCLHLLVFISMLTHVSLIYIFDRLRYLKKIDEQICKTTMAFLGHPKYHLSCQNWKYEGLDLHRQKSTVKMLKVHGGIWRNHVSKSRPFSISVDIYLRCSKVTTAEVTGKTLGEKIDLGSNMFG